jgi:DNA polymerase-3 subunit delta'
VTEQLAGELPWLEPFWARVTDACRQNRLPHALLLTGQPGMGKAAFAEALARILLCERPVESREPCGQCTSCTLFAAGTHPDFFCVTPVEDSRVIKIDQVRELSENLALTSHGNGYKVAILIPADAMNINAANSLLKTLEEPSDNTVLVLVSAQPARLPATVRSRCQEIRIQAADREQSRRWLTERYDGPSPELYLALANGAPLHALQLAQGQTLEERQRRFQQLVAIGARQESPLTVAQNWAADENLQGLRWLQEWLMDMLRIRLGGAAQGIHGIDLRDDLTRLARKLDSRVLYAMLDAVNRTLGLADSTLNRQLMMEDILLGWAEQTSRD